jgi:uncharacterized protein YndB with AHSA1/START domain
MSSFVQHVHLNSSPDRVFGALARSQDHAAFTGAPAEIGAAAGDPWSAFGGKIHGVNVEVVPGTRLVQAWRSAAWTPGVYSLVTFAVEGKDGGTQLTMTHDAVPDGAQAMLEGGWEQMYWGPLRTWLAQG